MPRTKFNVLAQNLQEVMEETLPKMVNDRVKELTKRQVPIYVAHGLIMERQQSQAKVAKMIADAIQKERENIRAEISSQKTSEHGTYVFGESSSGQDNESEPGPSTSGNQEQLDDFDFWTNSYATDDDELPTEKVSQELVEEMSQTVDEAKLRKVVNEIKEILVSPHPQKPTPVVQSCQRDPKAPALSLVNQDLLNLKKGNSRPEKIVMSLHKFPAVIFPDHDIEERTSNRKQKEPGKSKEVVYSNSKIVQIIKTYWELGHENKFIIEIIARRANGNIVSITESDYKNLNKNDIEDMYMLIVNGKLGVESYQQKVNLTTPIVTFSGIEKHKVFFIVSEPVYGIIYKNNKKEKIVMRHQEIHKFRDATLKRVWEGLNNYNNDVKHAYVTPSLSKEDTEYLQLFEEEIEEWLNHRDQIRRCEMYVNGRPLGSRKDCPK
ncbi:hypothetical protein Tco_1118260 [Tanacetum coccineum]